VADVRERFHKSKTPRLLPAGLFFISNRMPTLWSGQATVLDLEELLLSEPEVSSEPLNDALRRARDTIGLEIGRGALARAADAFARQFPGQSAVQVYDPATFGAIARAPTDLDLPGGMVMFQELSADWPSLQAVESALAQHDAIAVAVGSGTISDLVKLASHRLGRPYMCVATAASMDGYAAYGASITKDGVKQTFACPAPRVIVADIDVLEAAPPAMTASGYADLLAKIPAGADWILADALGIEPIEPRVWDMVQNNLRATLSHPIDLQRLTEGLLMSGLAMQAAQSSRPASGAEHQLSHLWDMQHATDASHGFKVGVATLAVTRLYERLMEQSVGSLAVQSAAARWPAWDAMEREIIYLFDDDRIRAAASIESKAKYITADALVEQLTRLREIWPDLSSRLREQLLPSPTVEKMLRDAGAPTTPQEIGILQERLRDSFKLACRIRRRFTVLDLVERANL
jgi:glycerol-1-phosphate dehydrogenase [NAD(P)+]